MAPVTLPPSFNSSFWSPDVRTGLDVVFNQLENGVLENKDIAVFIESQARANNQLAQALLEPPIGSTRAGASSLQHTLLALKAASAARGDVHRAFARELEEHVLQPFNGWRQRHEDRIAAAREEMLGRGGVVGSWEKEVQKLVGNRSSYLYKTRQADDSEDDAKFAPSAVGADPYSPAKGAANLRRSGTVADRISEKLRGAGSGTHSRSSSMGTRSPPASDSSPVSPTKASTGAKPKPPRLESIAQAMEEGPAAATDSPSSPTQEDAFIPPEDPHGLPTMEGPPAVPGKDSADGGPAKHAPEQLVLLSGVSLSAQAFKDLLTRFDHYLQTHAALGSPLHGELSTRTVLASRERNTIIGAYQKTFSGIEAVEWLRKNVDQFGGEWNRCIDAASELYRTGHIGRIGVGRGFDPSDDTFYTLKLATTADGLSLSQLQTQFKDMNLGAHLPSPISAGTAEKYSSMFRSYIPASLNTSDEPLHLRLRRDANRANEAYRASVTASEDRRLDMEERVEFGLRLWEKWERERLGVVRTVLKHYEGALAKLPKRLGELQESTGLAVEAFNPDADFKALIEGSRTGPFRPRPHIFESAESEVPDVNFGIDLRRWSGETAWRSLVTQAERPKDAIPDVLTALLKAVTEMDADISPDERRKSWLYEVPLTQTHALRSQINNPHMPVDVMVDIAKETNVPIAANTTKLWFLELNPPVLGWEGWEDAKAIYPSVGADQERDMSSAVTSVIERLPACQLFSLNALVKHYKDLIASTKSADEDDSVYITKLALSTGRCILRPQFETELTIQDRTPGLFLVDLIEHYDTVFPALLQKKKAEASRPMPQRKRTVLVDHRISRSMLDAAHTPEQLLAEQARGAHPVPAGAGAPAPSQVPVAPVSAATAPAVETAPSPAAPAPTAAAAVPAPAASGAADSDEDEPAFEPPFTTPSASPLPGASSPLNASTASAAATGGDDELAAPASGLKRSGSNETSRLRGPRGARGPRPSGAAAGPHTRGPSVGAVAAQFEAGDAN